jgi:hypothetical protein
MASLVIRDINPELKRIIRELAQQSGQSVSAEAKSLIRSRIFVDERVSFGTRLFNLVDDNVRADDLVFERKQRAT